MPSSARRSTTYAEVRAETLVLTWEQLNGHVEALALQIQAVPADQCPDRLIAISRSGLVPGATDFFMALADDWTTYSYKGGE